jgi:cytochrome c peroxidase
MSLVMQGIFSSALFMFNHPLNTIIMKHSLRRSCALFLALVIPLLASCTRAVPEKSASNQNPSQISPQSTKRLATMKSDLLAQLHQQRLAVQRMDSLARRLDDTAAHVPLQTAFHEAHTTFKRVEWAVAYFTGGAAREMNGAPIDEFEEADGIVVPATGFQVLEASLFPQVNAEDSVVIRHNTRIMLDLITRSEKVFAVQEFTDAHIFDALWLEVARVQTLGISGFDAPVRLTGIEDAAVVLESISAILALYQDPQNQQNQQTPENPASHSPPLTRGERGDTAFTALQYSLSGAIAYCRTNTDFDAFDRAEWFMRWVNPVAGNIKNFQAALGITPLDMPTAFRPNVRTIFDSAAFNVQHFAPLFSRNVPDNQVNARTELGKRLFYDPVLSGAGNRACASCHKPERAFTDGLAHSEALTPQGKVKRNAPTILNAALQTALFADLRVAFLEDQATDVMQNTDEMHGSLKEAVRKLGNDVAYRQAFARAFGDTSAQPISEMHIKQAIAAYERSLVSLNSRFDRYIRSYARGDTALLTATEKHGFNLYMGKAKCGTCHFAPLFNGTVPPTYNRTEQEVIGVPVRAVSAHARIDGDVGRFAMNKYEPHRYAFKTPTVRNAALTAPYMHNGAYRTLEQVMDFYNRGGGLGIGIDPRVLPHQTLAADPLRLSREEQRAVIAFLGALTDVPTTHTPAKVAVGMRLARASSR